MKKNLTFNLFSMAFKEFTEEIRNKVLEALRENGAIYDDFDYNVTFGKDDWTTFQGDYSVTLVISDGTRVWALHQYFENEQTIGTFFLKGDDMVVATVPFEVMEAANVLRQLNGKGELEEVWDYINNENAKED